MTRPLISFIIPAFNSQEHLNECVTSITNQVFYQTNYEIIIINDASKDNTLDICNKLKKKNIKIVNNKKNLGVSLSRNKGIKLSKGEYLFFLDSDDRLCNSAIPRIIKTVKFKDADLFFYLPNTNLIKKFGREKMIGTNDHVFNLLNNYDNFTAHPWNFIIRKNFLEKKKIFFNNIKTFEDQVFTSKILVKAEKIDFFSKKICNHSERLNSLSRKTNSLTIFSILDVIYEVSSLIFKDKLSQKKKIFLIKRITFLIKLLKSYFVISQKRDEARIKTYLKKINDKLIFSSNKIKFNDLSQISKKAKYEIEKLRKFKNKNIYIFGSGMYGRLTSKLLLKYSINFNSFLDNNKKFDGKFCLNKPISSFKKIFPLSHDQLDHIMVVLPLDNKEDILKIFKKFQGYGLNKKNIKVINWRKITK